MAIREDQEPLEPAAGPEMANRRSIRSRAGLFLAIGLAGLGVSGLVYWALLVRERGLIRAEFRFDAEQRIGAIRRDVAASFDAVGSLVAFYDASDAVEEDEFGKFAATRLARHESVRQLAWAPLIRAEELGAHQQAVRRSGGPGGREDYRVWKLDERGRRVPAQSRPEHFPVLFLQPEDRGTLSPGFDLASSPACLAAIDRARKHKGMDATGHIALGDGGDRVRRCFVIAPVYRKQKLADAPPDSGDDLHGFVLGVCEISRIMEEVIRRTRSEGIAFRLFDRTAGGEELLCARSAADGDEPPAPAANGEVHQGEVLGLPGRQWWIDCTQTEAYAAREETSLPFAVFAAGLVITVLLAMYVSALTVRAAKVEQLVIHRTAQLRRANESLGQQIAERERANEVRKDSEALYSSLVENLPVQVLRKDLEGKFTFANKSFCDLLGKPLEEIAGKTDFDLYPRELAQKYREDDRRVAETGELFEDIEENKKDSETRYVQVMKSAVRDAEGKIIGVQVIFWDVTKRKTAEAALEQERYLLHALMDNLPHNIYFKDAESRFIRINKALADCFGLGDAAEALGKTDFDYFTDEHAQQAREDEIELMRSGRPLLDKEEKETWMEGRVTWAATTKLPLYNEEGRIVGTFGISRDITEKKQAAEALRAAKEAAETANRAKSDFLAHMSHEIRTPMNAIIGMTELVLDTELNASQREYLKMVRESGESLLLLINDILDFSKIEAGKLELDRAPFGLRENLGDTMKSLALRAHAKGLELACQVRPDVPDDLIGDAGRLRQVVVNLVGNAIKFTETGEVVLNVERRGQSDDEVELQFAVTDTGIGIPEEKRTAIFDAFEQADTSTTRRFGGTGLGLAISSRLVGFMGGRIGVESEVGRGSTFHFTARLGLATGEPAPAPRVRAATIAGVRALVVDDNATNRRILEEMLGSWQMQPASAEGVRDALELLRRAQQAGEPFVLVLTDANMPDLDGFALAEAIKQDKELSSTIIMMLTSGDRAGDVARCERLGIAAYLMKPIKQSELLEAIVMALGITASEDERAEKLAAGRARRLPPLRILLAEDSLVSQKLVLGLLGREGHTLVVVNNGKEAIAVLETENFDLVLMDVQMPEMDGLEATAAIRAREQSTGGHVPIIAMTAHAMKGDRERCLQAGMDQYIAKPVRAQRLFDTMEDLLCGSGGLKGAPGVPPARPEWTAAEAEVVNWSEALRTVRGDRELLRSVVEAFLEEGPRLMAAIREATAGGSASSLRMAAHTLKGSMRHLGAARAFVRALQLEEMGQQGNLAKAEAALAALEEEMAQLTPVLLDYMQANETAGDS